MTDIPDAQVVPVLGYEQRSEQLWPIVRLVLLAGVAYFLSAPIGTALNLVRSQSVGGQYAVLSDYQATALALSEVISPFFVAIGCALSLRGAAPVRFVLWAIGIWMVVHLVYAIKIALSYAAISGALPYLQKDT